MTIGRDVYLVDVPLEDARARFFAALGEVRDAPSERVALSDALDRVTAKPVTARLSSPHYHACAMDGFAVASAATRGAREGEPVVLRRGEAAVLVDTGDPLPPQCDAVIMIEEVEERDDGTIAIRAPAAPGQHVRGIGEDVVASEVVVGARRRLRPADLAAIASTGICEIDVIRRPRVGIITTGTELVDPSIAAPPRGAILDSNGVLLEACVRSYGGIPQRYPRVVDDESKILAALDRALAECDVAIINAGSSAGTEDFTARIFEARGELLVHGVAIRPGHPLVLAVTQKGERTIPLLGIPGYPVSAAVCAEQFLRPLIERMAGLDTFAHEEIEVVVARKIFSSFGEDEYVRAVAARIDDQVVAFPLQRGAATIAALSRANCLIVVPRFQEGIHAGTKVRAQALRSRGAIERALLIVGSHDVAIDLLAAALAADGIEITAANVGSVAGLIALANGATHLAGTHILDRETRTYNRAAVRRYGPKEAVALIHLADREQGLIVAPGNPLGLRSLQDIARKRARYVNRQKDAGTRILLDALLADEGLAPAAIAGYERIELTHVGVAALVADGSVDCGLGIRAAATVLGCDFVSLVWEPYELALPARNLETRRVTAILGALSTDELRSAIERLGGYRCARAGEVSLVEGEPA
jgi:putative molybdopterin biosynthesis protein